MIEILVDAVSVAPNHFELHQQSHPFPGGSRYKLRTNDRELTAVVRNRYSLTTLREMQPSDISHVFNLVRMFFSLKYEKSTPLFWANTIDQIRVEGDVMELTGECSPHVK